MILNLIFAVYFLRLIYGCYLKEFDDTVLYKIDWLKSLDIEFDEKKFEPVIITSPDEEKYRCIIPHLNSKEEDDRSVDTNLSPLHFLSPIFSSSSCSYRLEAYWAYEICHGHHVKQYHEDREGKNTKIQEYYLGKWDLEKTENLQKTIKEDRENGRKFKTLKIDNVRYPYLEMEMSDGTVCDLNDESRVTKIRYVCYPHGKNEIYSLKETSTCNYEAIILTPALCMHPAFIPEDTNENVINCSPLDDSPTKPLSWFINEIDNFKHRYRQILDGSLKMELVQGDLFEKIQTIDVSNINEDKSVITKMSAFTMSSTINDAPKLFEAKDTSSLNEFLEGKNCLIGGAGWWKYEFCFGRYVRQFHKDKNGEVSIMLGLFDKKLHKEWLKSKQEEKNSRVITKHTIVSHFYQGGTVCDKTGEKRQTEVKLKCPANVLSPSTISMYLLEPKTCQYILVVEGSIICDILSMVDDDGLIAQKSSEENTDEGKKDGKTVYNDNILIDEL